MIGVGSGPSLDNVERVAVGIRVFIDPDLLVLEPDRVDHQRVPFPTPNLLAKKRRVRIIRMFALRIDRDQAKVGVPVKEGDFLGALQYFKRQPAGIVPRNTSDDAEAFWIDRG